MPSPLSDLPPHFQRALDIWRASQLASDETRQGLARQLAGQLEGDTNLYFVDMRRPSPDRFGFHIMVGNFDIGVPGDEKDMLGNHPDRRHLREDLLPHYGHVAATGEVRLDSIRQIILSHFAHYDRLILPLSVGKRTMPGEKPTHALSLSKPRFIVAPAEGSTRDLSGREHVIFNLVVNGLTTKEIARELALSPRTVETHLGKIKTKMGARNITHAVALYLLRSSF